MPSSRIVVVVLAVMATALTLWWMRSAGAVKSVSAPVPAAPTSHTISTPGDSAATAIVAAAAAAADPDRITTADALGAPGGSVQGDLTILVTLFEDWRSFFPGDGNPWGDNAEITAMLNGKNRRKLVFIDKAHRAINAEGELCDRWGTPFRFHSLAGDRMEVRSAGPDKTFGTPDDASVTPP